FFPSFHYLVVRVCFATGMRCDRHQPMPPRMRRGFAIWFLKGFLAVVLGVILAARAGRAMDWPQFRGPNRDGTWQETGILESFPKGGVKIQWRRPVGGGFSSPVVAQGRAFVFDVELIKPTAR